jgi:hypothetical protein
MPMQSPAIAAGERWDGCGEAGDANGAIGTAGSNVVVGWVVVMLEAVGSSGDGVGAVEMSTTRLGCAVVAR